MIWLHIGMPKTGTTALQSFLRGLPEDAGLHYVGAGRQRTKTESLLISHNTLAIALNAHREAEIEKLGQAFVQEMASIQDKPCVMSSEMFFSRDLSLLGKHFFSQIDIPVNVIFYLRRFDDFFEADYKQRVKNGRFAGGVEAFVEERLKEIDANPTFMNFETVVTQLQEQIPNGTVHPKLYIRTEMAGEDVVTDFLTAIGLDPKDFPAPPDRQANQSLSRLASEALGVMANAAGSNFDKKAHRQLLRTLQGKKATMFHGKGDVFTADERRMLNDRLEERNEGFRKTWFPKRKRLFPQVTKAEMENQIERGSADELLRFQHLMTLILQRTAAQPES